jgi:hypothetical protein
MYESNGEEDVPTRRQKSTGNGKASVVKKKTIEEIYTKKTQLEHILLRPDTYIGSVEMQTQAMWILDNETNEIVYQNCTHVPGLYKIFGNIFFCFYHFYSSIHEYIVIRISKNDDFQYIQMRYWSMLQITSNMIRQ